MGLIRELSRAIRVTLALWVLVAVLYPAVVLGIGQGLFSHQANGSLIRNPQGQVTGSTLIGQPFQSDRYFHSRPSANNYSSADPQNDPNNLLKTGISGGSNLAPSNPDLLKRIQATVTKTQQNSPPPSADLVYTSGSGLDPHITLAAAKLQIPRIARSRKLNPNQLEILIASHTDGPFLGIFGEPGVNVLRLNLALDEMSS
jgi:potassium-transporting ATPase KdpC subunit